MRPTAYLRALDLLTLFTAGCKKDDEDPQPTPPPPATPVTVTDIDGNTYSTVNIGAQVWMAVNLRTSKYRDGSTIPEVTENTSWEGLSTGAWSNYGNYAPNNDTYGKLYNWHAVNDTRGLCPQGWHVPSDAEWKALETTLGMPANELNNVGYRGDAANVGGKLKAVDQLWEPPNTGASNSSGFSALPGGHRNSDGQFVGVRYYGD